MSDHDIDVRAGQKIRTGRQTIQVAEDVTIPGEIVDTTPQTNRHLKLICSDTACRAYQTATIGILWHVRTTRAQVKRHGAAQCPHCGVPATFVTSADR